MEYILNKGIYQGTLKGFKSPSETPFLAQAFQPRADQIWPTFQRVQIFLKIYMYILFSLLEFFKSALDDGFPWSLSDSESPGLGVVAMKEYFAFSKFFRLKPHFRWFCIIFMTLVEKVLLTCWGIAGIFYGPTWLVRMIM